MNRECGAATPARFGPLGDPEIAEGADAKTAVATAVTSARIDWLGIPLDPDAAAASGAIDWLGIPLASRRRLSTGRAAALGRRSC